MNTEISHMIVADVIRVLDCNTVIVSADGQELTLRLDGIDCPRSDQYWDLASKRGLRKLIGRRRIHIENHGTDAEGRILATVYLPPSDTTKQINVNVRMLLLGHAWVATEVFAQLPTGRYKELIRAERWARSKRMGLWGTGNALDPSRWRRIGKC